jgi:hypothetical protein
MRFDVNDKRNQCLENIILAAQMRGRHAKCCVYWHVIKDDQSKQSRYSMFAHP